MNHYQYTALPKFYTEDLIATFIANEEYYAHLIIPIKQQRMALEGTMPGVFFVEIHKQYFDRIKWVIVTDIAYRMPHVPVDEILMFMESVNLETI